ncbi:MAG: BadF/BadG/BcrA/BcrD ATPase family protein [Desulfobacter sp.]
MKPLAAQKDLQINSMCTVFAESEVTSLIAKGQDRQQIARGLHLSVVKRAVGMLNRVGAQGPVVFSGGVAQNPCMVQMVADALEKEVLVPNHPQMMGALGAAMIMAEKQ